MFFCLLLQEQPIAILVNNYHYEYMYISESRLNNGISLLQMTSRTYIYDTYKQLTHKNIQNDIGTYTIL